MTSSIHPTVRLTKHQKLTGVWNSRSYMIVRLLGEGARGSIYLAMFNNRYVAIKISQDSSVISAEVNVLKMLKKVQGRLGPLLLDVDDCQINQQTKYAFYVMEYIDGVPLNEWIESKGLKWIFPLSSQLLSQLQTLHESGYIFGDLKPENILVENKSQRLRLVDVGGVTPFGRSIREYTTWYDRGYWKMGDRRSDPQYDLFAYAICILGMDPKINIQKSNERNIIKLVQSASSLKPLHGVLVKSVNGQFSSALEMKEAIERVNKQQLKKATAYKVNKKQNSNHILADLIGIGSIISVHLFLFYYFVW